MISEDEFTELFAGCGTCLLVLNGCSTERLADRLVRASPNITTISVAGNILRRDALRAIDEIYGLLFTRISPVEVAQIASNAVRRRMPTRSSGAPIQARGRRVGSPLFDVGTGTGRPTYYACAPPANLPPQHRPVVDRAEELLEFHELLFGEGVGGPYIGLVGITGGGKTAVVQAVAARYGWRFRGGIGYFSLRGGFSVSDLAAVFGWPRTEHPMRVEDAAARLAQERYLLVFDDMDQASESGIAEVIALLKSWDTSLGGRAILVFHSHRAEFQAIIGANWITLKQLPTDASRELIVSCLGGPDKARRTIGTDEQLSEATRLLLGHPKTIEYAASLLQLGQPWADMRDDLVRLSGEGPLAVNDEMLSRVITLLERRAPAVRDLLDAWLVFEDSARESVWRKIAVNSGADQRSVKAQLDAALNELHGAALIDRHGQAGDTRCIMHSLLVAHLRRRHAMLSEEKMRELVQTQLIEQARLAREDHYPAGESGNIRRVVQVAERLGLWRNLVDYCVAVVGQQGLPLVRRGPWALARELLDAAVRAAAECADQEWEARFLLVRGTVEYRLAAFESAARAYEQAAALADAAGARSLRLQALRGVGQVHYRTGDLLAAERLYHTARILAEDDESSMADIDHQLAKILYRKGRLNEARDLLTRVRATRERSGHDRDLAKTIHEQARIEHVAGQGERARALYEEALRLERQVKDPVMEQATLFQLARLALDRGSTAEAQDLFSDSRRISEELGDQVWIVHAQFGQALLDWDQGNRDSALQQGKTALSESRKLRIGLTAEIQEWLDTHLDSVPRGSE